MKGIFRLVKLCFIGLQLGRAFLVSNVHDLRGLRTVSAAIYYIVMLFKFGQKSNDQIG